MSESKDQINELTQFLLPDAPPVTKGPAVVYLLGLTATEDGLAVFRSQKSLIDALVNILRRDSNPRIIGKAYECVLNLSSHKDFAVYLLDSCTDFVKHSLVPTALDVGTTNVLRACAILANLSAAEDCTEKLWFLLKPSADDFLTAFCKRNPLNSAILPSSTEAAKKTADPSQDHIAFVFANLTSLSAVRSWLTDPEHRRLEKLLHCVSGITPTDSVSATRKHGAVGTIRNCTFDTECHEWLLEELNILPRLLTPLIGPEVDENLDEEEMEKLPVDCQYLGTEKKLEANADIRKMLIESMTQLCATRLGRQHLKDNGVYFVLRELHKVEKDRPVMVALENLVDILIQDEPEQDNLKDIEIPADLEEKFKKMDAEALQEIE